MESFISSFRNFSLNIRPTLLVISQKYNHANSNTDNENFIDCEKGLTFNDQNDKTIEPKGFDEEIIYTSKSYVEIDDDPSYLKIPAAKSHEFYSPHFVIDMTGIAY